MNFIIKLLAFILSVSVPDAEGWVPVERPLSAVSPGEEGGNSSVWVVFSKKHGATKWMARFPEEPQVISFGEKGFEVRAKGERATFHLSAVPGQIEQRIAEVIHQPDTLLLKVERRQNEADLLYQMQGKWVQEHLVQTGPHFYAFQTQSESFLVEAHAYFFRSFSLVKS